jgi:hypothetical protein
MGKTGRRKELVNLLNREVNMFSKSFCFSAKKAFLFFLIFGIFLPLSALGGPNSSVLSSASPNLSNGPFNRLYLPLTIKCAGCQNLIGNWKINTPDETHRATFYTNGTFSMIFQGETTAHYGNYTCSGSQFEGLIVVETVSLKVKGALTCNGKGMNGTWENRNNGALIDTGNFSGEKL